MAGVVRKYKSLALIFNFITIDAERSIRDQHAELRRLFRESEARPWSDWNAEAVAEWLRGAAGDSDESEGTGCALHRRRRERARARDGRAANCPVGRRSLKGVSCFDASGLFELSSSTTARPARYRRGRCCCSTQPTWRFA